MKWVPVDSTTIAFIGYDQLWCVLGLEFRETGDAYWYFGVPPEEYAAFMAAESKGEYLNRVFKNKGYRYVGPRKRLKRTA